MVKSLTERKKMAQGLLYDAWDEEIVAMRAACKELCYDYNNLRPNDVKGRAALLKKLLGKTGKNPNIEPPFWCDYGCNITVGDNFDMNHGCVILDGGGVTFGDNVFVAPQCGFHTAGHPLDFMQRNKGIEYAYPIVVGNNVWIGAGVTVVPGVTIGDNTVIGAGSVVTKDIPAGVLAVGNPCRIVREITQEDRKRYIR